MFTGIITSALTGLILFAQTPTSTNFKLPSYDIGNGGTDNSSSTNFRLNGTTGTQTGDPQSSTNFRLNSGENPTQNANVTGAPTLSNPDNYYDRLRLVINESGNPSDTRYLIAISSDGFATSRYVQTDNSLGNSTALANYRTYSSFGGGSGFLILGLSPSTSYQARVKAFRGSFTENSFGVASSSAATVSQSLSFGISTSLTPTPPFSATFMSLTPGTIFSANADINIALSTNAGAGGSVYINSQNASLFSSSQSFSIPSATADLAVAQSGYGGQISSTSQSSGGPLNIQAPYNGFAGNVGALQTTSQSLLSTTGPVNSGTAVLLLKAKTASDAPSASDYADQITIIAAMNY